MCNIIYLSLLCLQGIAVLVQSGEVVNTSDPQLNFTTTLSNDSLTTIEPDRTTFNFDDYEGPEPETTTPFQPPRDPVEFMDYFEDMVKMFRGHLEEVFETYMPRIFEISSSVVLSPDCTYDVVRVLMALREMKPWAVKLLDANGKVPDGILYGTFSSLGAYDECLETVVGDEPSADSRIVTGKYCSVDIKPYLPPKPPFKTLARAFSDAADAKGYPKKDHFSRLAPIFYYLKFRLGVCIPSSCTKDDLKAITGSLSLRLRLNVSVEACEVKESFNVTNDQVVAGGVLCAILSIVLLATTVDVVRRFVSPTFMSGLHGESGAELPATLKRLLNRCWLAFSAYTNSSQLLSTEVPDHAIRSLYGLKVISLLWVILAHAYLTLDLKAVGALMRTRDVNRNFIFQLVINASLAIETFFFISGLLVTLTVFRRLKKNPRISHKEWIWFYVHRIVRMTPAVVLVIAIVIAAYKFGDGPLWREIIYPSAERCRENWWIHFLHISNFFDVSRMCFIHLWYIAADMQLFIFTPFLLILLFKKPFVGRCAMLVLVLLSVVTTGVVTFYDRLPPTLMFDNPDPLSRKPFGDVILVKPYPHAAPYLIGMLTGYILHHNPKISFSKLVTAAGWTCSVAVITCATFITWEWNKGFMPSPWFGAFYAAFFRSLWALAMSWITLACHNGKGGIINTILSWEMFIPMSRVSYTAYLIHPGLMYIFVASTRSLFMFSHFVVLYLFFSHLVATFAASFVLSLLIETPFVALETVFFQHIFKGGKEKRKYYYSVNPIPSLEGSEKKTKKPREGTSNGHASSPSVNGLREHLPLEEKFSGASVDSTSILVKTNGHGPTLIHRNDKPPLTSNTADADFDCRL